MFDHLDSGVGLLPGESVDEFLAGDEDVEWEAVGEALGEEWGEPVRHSLPPGLEDLPFPFLAVIVSAVDPERLNGHDAVRLMQAQARLVSHHEAGKLAAVAEVAFSPPGDADSPVERSFEEIEYSAVEVAAALGLTRRAAEGLVGRALALKGGLRRVWQALSDGVIDVAKTRIFDRQLGHLPDATVDQVLDETLDDAGGLTTGQLQARVRRQVLTVDPDGSEACFLEGLAERKTTVSANPDHTANYHILSAHPTAVAAAREYVEKLARGLKTSDEPRSLDELRNDVALDLLSGKCVHGVKSGGRANICVSGETLAGLSDEPGELAGFGPVFAEIARKTIREQVDGEWRFVVTDNGQPVATGTLARRPTASQQRQITALYPKCVMVGCRQDAWDCDLDHRRPHACGGPTHNDNLGPLCRHHHMTRHHGHWQLERNENGDHQWTSPLGHTYTRKRGPPE